MGEVAKAAAEEEELPPVPWHLKLLGVLIVIYLLYRLFQALGWLVS